MDGALPQAPATGRVDERDVGSPARPLRKVSILRGPVPTEKATAPALSVLMTLHPMLFSLLSIWPCGKPKRFPSPEEMTQIRGWTAPTLSITCKPARYAVMNEC